MRVYTLGLLTILAVSGGCSSQNKNEGKTVNLEAFEDKFSYMVGYQVGRSLKEQGVEPNLEVLKAAIQDQLAGREPQLSEQDMQATFMEHNQRRVQEQQQESVANKTAAEEFLTKNKSAEGVSELQEGLQYQVITAGSGEKPKETSTVKVHYKGSLLDGSEFDSSYKRNEPASFPLNRVIKGWTEALKNMPVGSKWKIWIHPDLAYGPTARPGIPGNSLLVFEVELLEIES